MNNLRVTTQCFRCQKEVHPSQARSIISVTKDERYECFDCFKRNKIDPLLPPEKIKPKKGCFCERCKYRFMSAKSVCPYCNKDDMVVVGNVTVKDLL